MGDKPTKIVIYRGYSWDTKECSVKSLEYGNWMCLK